MKIAISADFHLIDSKVHPERLTTFSNVLKQCSELDVEMLIVSGDLFDKEIQNYSDFEKVYKKNCPKGLKTLVLPGNHDVGLQQGMFAITDFEILSEPEIKLLDDDLYGMFIPYQGGVSMGESISDCYQDVEGKTWLLFGHGDWAQTVRQPSGYEQDGYMPLTQFDLARFKPLMVFLGHIHKRFDSESLYYPGSPCPLDITEVGLRHFLLLDTSSRKIRKEIVNAPLLFYNEEFVVLPDDDGIDRLTSEMRETIKLWDIPEEKKDRIRIRVKVSGYTSDKLALRKAVVDAFTGFSFYDPDGPILDEVNFANDLDKAQITESFMNWVNDLEWPEEPIKITKDELVHQALKLIYGG